MIKTFYPKYKNHKIAVISPCNAKKREFVETSLGDYNIAYISIDKFITENNIFLGNFAETGYDNPSAERAVMFSTPGGLLQTAERSNPELRYKTRKIEGIEIIYDYLNELPEIIDNKKAPLLIYCLSCNYGCNGGPLTIAKDKPIDEIEHWVSKRSQEMEQFYSE